MTNIVDPRQGAASALEYKIQARVVTERLSRMPLSLSFDVRHRKKKEKTTTTNGPFTFPNMMCRLCRTVRRKNPLSSFARHRTEEARSTSKSVLSLPQSLPSRMLSPGHSQAERMASAGRCYTDSTAKRTCRHDKLALRRCYRFRARHPKVMSDGVCLQVPSSVTKRGEAA